MPDSFTTGFDIEHDNSQESIVWSPESHDPPFDATPHSPLEYHFILSKVAKVIHAHSKIGKASAASAREALRKLDQITSGLPSHLKSTKEANLLQPNQRPAWVIIQRLALSNLLRACRINLCFSCLPRLLQTGQDEFCLQDSGREAATELVEAQHWDQTKVGNKLWGTTASIMAAGMFLLLDLICFKESKTLEQVANQLATVHLSVQLLQDAATSKIDGSAVLKRLLHMYNIRFASQAVDRQMLLTIMKQASVPAELGNPTMQQDYQVSQSFQQSISEVDLGFSFPAMEEPFQGEPGINLDYMHFDMEQVLPSIDLEAELGLFSVLHDTKF